MNFSGLDVSIAMTADGFPAISLRCPDNHQWHPHLRVTIRATTRSPPFANVLLYYYGNNDTYTSFLRPMPLDRKPCKTCQGAGHVLAAHNSSDFEPGLYVGCQDCHVRGYIQAAVPLVDAAEYEESVKAQAAVTPLAGVADRHCSWCNQPATHIAIPCGHICICYLCIRKHSTTNPKPIDVCPICQKADVKWYQVY